MQSYEEIFALAAARHGGETGLTPLLNKPESTAKLKRIPDDRWLSQMTKSIFQAGFVWRVVENKWADFETVFRKFDLHHCAYLSDESLEAMLTDRRVIRHHKKLLSTRHNAAFLLELGTEYGSVSSFFATQGPQNYVDVLFKLKKEASRLGGMSAQYFLRRMGVDSFILSRDVIAALMRASIVDKNPTSKRDLYNVQEAFNYWCEQSGRSLTEVSRTLALSID